MDTLWLPLQTKTPWSPPAAHTSHANSLLREKPSALTIGPSHDPLEAEADAVAERVLTGSRLPAIGGSAADVQRSQVAASDQTSVAPASVDHALSSPGMPLDSALRQEMERRFAHDFSRVRVHTGAAADQSAHDLSAHAYTLGRDIVFGRGRYAPESADGRQLLAHELTHVVQQSLSSRLTGEHIQCSSWKKGPTTKPHS